MENEIERRSFAIAELRVDVAADGKKPMIRGYAAVFDKFSEDMGGFKEKVARGAFSKTLEADDIRALWNHDPNWVLGRTKAGTLRLAEDDKGLAIEIDPPETQWAQDLAVSIRRGDVSQMSFGFIAIKDDWLNITGGRGQKTAERTLLECKLFDVSPVTFPAYPQTSVKVRDYLNAIKSESQGVSETGRAGALIIDQWKLRK
jgi:HK97 family phage prohead protease